MKQVIVSITLSTVLCAVTLAQSGGNVKDEVLAAQKRFAESSKACSAQQMEPLVTDDIVWIHPGGGGENGKGEVVKSHANPQSPFCPWDEWRIDVRNVNIYGDAAVVVGDLHYKPKGKDAGAPLTALQIYVKRNGRWLLAAAQQQSQTTK
jgi:ketosteroid isomerase-like protein